MVVYQTPLAMGFPRQEYWSGLPFPSSGDLSNPGKFALQADSLLSEPPEKPIHLSFNADNSKSKEYTVSYSDQ